MSSCTGKPDENIAARRVRRDGVTGVGDVCETNHNKARRQKSKEQRTPNCTVLREDKGSLRKIRESGKKRREQAARAAGIEIDVKNEAIKYST